MDPPPVEAPATIYSTCLLLSTWAHAVGGVAPRTTDWQLLSSGDVTIRWHLDLLSTEVCAQTLNTGFSLADAWRRVRTMSPAKKKSSAKMAKAPMGAAHKAALAEGRANARAVRRYLELLEANKPKRGRKRTPDSIRKQLAAIEDQLPDAGVLARLQLIQQRTDLTDELAGLEAGGTSAEDLASAEADFVSSAAAYASAKGISRASFRTMGVPASVLKAAGIDR